MLSEVALLSAHLNLNLSKARSVRKYKYISPAFPSCGESFVSESGSILMAPRASEFTTYVIILHKAKLTSYCNWRWIRISTTFEQRLPREWSLPCNYGETCFSSVYSPLRKISPVKAVTKVRSVLT